MLPPPSEITVSVGRTFNLGNFNSLRIELTETYPVSTGADDIQAMEDQAFYMLLHRIMGLYDNRDLLQANTDPRTEEPAPQPDSTPTPQPAPAPQPDSTPTPQPAPAPIAPEARVNPQAILYKLLNKSEVPKPTYTRLCQLLRAELKAKQVKPIRDIYQVRSDILTAFLLEEGIIH